MIGPNSTVWQTSRQSGLLLKAVPWLSSWTAAAMLMKEKRIAWW